MKTKDLLERRWNRKTKGAASVKRKAFARQLIHHYGQGNPGTYSRQPLWKIGYVCGLRDAGLLTWDEWCTIMDEVKNESSN